MCFVGLLFTIFFVLGIVYFFFLMCWTPSAATKRMAVPSESELADAAAGLMALQAATQNTASLAALTPNMEAQRALETAAWHPPWASVRSGTHVSEAAAATDQMHSITNEADAVAAPTVLTDDGMPNAANPPPAGAPTFITKWLARANSAARDVAASSRWMDVVLLLLTVTLGTLGIWAFVRTWTDPVTVVAALGSATAPHVGDASPLARGATGVQGTPGDAALRVVGTDPSTGAVSAAWQATAEGGGNVVNVPTRSQPVYAPTGSLVVSAGPTGVNGANVMTGSAPTAAPVALVLYPNGTAAFNRGALDPARFGVLRFNGTGTTCIVHLQPAVTVPLTPFSTLCLRLVGGTAAAFAFGVSVPTVLTLTDGSGNVIGFSVQGVTGTVYEYEIIEHAGDVVVGSGSGATLVGHNVSTNVVVAS